MAVVGTLRLAAVEGDCRRAILARHASLGHRRLRLVLDAQHSAEGSCLPARGEFRSLACGIRWIGKGDIVRKRFQGFGKSERRKAVDSRHLTGIESSDVLLECTQTPRIFFYEVSGDGATRQRFQAKRTRAGVQIEHAGIRQIQLKNAHPRFANAIESWSDLRSAGCADSAATPAAGDYPHTRISAMRACR